MTTIMANDYTLLRDYLMAQTRADFVLKALGNLSLRP